MKIVIVGGVAGGATAAARIRRLDEKAEIVIFERTGFISYANCGLPYVYLRLTVLSLYMLCVKADFAVIFPAEYCRRRATIAIISPAAIASTPE